MRFQCHIGTGFQVRTPPVLRPAAVPAAQPSWRHRMRPGWSAAGVLLALAGCASLDAAVVPAWPIEPVLSVTHSAGSSQAYYAMGRYMDGSQAWDKAIDAYRKSIAADPRNVEARNALGVALAQAGRLAEAEAVLHQALALDPERAHVRSNLGYVLLLAGRPDEAATQLKAALLRERDNPTALANLREALEAAPGSETASRTVEHEDPRAAAGVDPGTAPAIDATPPQRPLRLEVSNGNGVAGMAARVGRWLSAQGAPVDRLSNQPRFTQQRTTIQYGNGYEAAAQQIARALPANARADTVPTPGLRSDVRVVLGRDWTSLRTAMPVTKVAANP